MDAELDALAALDAERRTLIPKVEELKRQQNASGEDVARAKKAGQDASHLFAANKARGAGIKALEAELDGIETRRRAILLTIPNLPHETVPVGAGAADNVEVRKWGEPPAFDFEPRSHSDLGVGLGIVDFERATRMSGARFAILLRRRRAAGAGAHRLHARPAHAASTATSRWTRRSWSTRPRCWGPGTCRSSSRTCSRSPATGTCISSRRPRCRSPTSTGRRSSTAGCCRGATPPTRPASGARRARTAST